MDFGGKHPLKRLQTYFHVIVKNCNITLTFTKTFYMLKFITTLYQIKIFSHCLFFLHLVFYTQMFVWTKFIMLNNVTHFLG